MPESIVSVLAEKLRVDFSDIAIGELLGTGSFKSVFRGRWGNTNVAIMCMHGGGMVAEARIMQRISSHPNLVQFYRWATDEQGNEYLVVELVRHGALDKLLTVHGRKLHTACKLTMCEQVCSAMNELAGEGILHRDLAARNILLHSTKPFHVKVRRGRGHLASLSPSALCPYRPWRPGMLMLVCGPMRTHPCRSLTLVSRAARAKPTPCSRCRYAGAPRRCCRTLSGQSRAMSGPLGSQCGRFSATAASPTPGFQTPR